MPLEPIRIPLFFAPEPDKVAEKINELVSVVNEQALLIKELQSKLTNGNLTNNQTTK